jgi:ABC-type enterochelin transport system substrate-binding protein
MRKLVVILTALVFVVGLVSAGFAAGTAKTAKAEGTVVKVEGKKVTVREAKGKEVTIETDKTVKVGDKVTIENGKIVKVETPAPAKNTKKKPAAPGY